LAELSRLDDRTLKDIGCRRTNLVPFGSAFDSRTGARAEADV